MKTIIHFIDSLGRGGAERVVLNTVSYNEDYHNIVVVLKATKVLEEQIKGELVVLEYDKKQKKAKKKLIDIFRDLVRARKVDIVHAHLPFPTWIARKALKDVEGVKLIFTVHNNYKFKAMRSPALYFKEKRNYSSDQIGVFVSQDAKEFYKKITGLKGESHVIHNFIDDSCYTKQKHESTYSKGNKLKMVASGNLRHQKNHKFLIDALSKLDKSKFELTIYGDGKLRSKLTELIVKNGLEKNVFLAGSIPNKELLSLLVANDLYVMPSLYEGFSLALCEAIILGMPCLLSDIKSSKENAKQAALYYKSGDTNDFREKINRILSDAEILKELSEKTKQRAETFVTSKQYVEKLKEIYN